jgi:hypothetical protein
VAEGARRGGAWHGSTNRRDGCEVAEGSGPWLGEKGWAKRAGQNMLLGQASAGSSFQWNMLSLQGHRLDLERGRTLLGRPIGERGGPTRGWQSRPVWRGRWVVR